MVLCFSFVWACLIIYQVYVVDYSLRKVCASTHIHSIQPVFFFSSVVFLFKTIWLILLFLHCKYTFYHESSCVWHQVLVGKY